MYLLNILHVIFLMLLLHETSFLLLHMLKNLMSLPLHFLESPNLCYAMLNIVYNCVKSKTHLLYFLEVIKYTLLFRTASSTGAGISTKVKPETR